MAHPGIKGKDVLSLARSEEQLVLVAYVNSGEFERNLRENKVNAIAQVLGKHQKDVDGLKQEHPALLQAILHWKGDLDGELRHSGPKSADAILGFFQQIEQVEGQIRSLFDTSKGIESQVQTELAKKSIPEIMDADHKDLLQEVHLLAEALRKWAGLAKQAREIITQADTYITDTQYKARSLKVDNYKEFKDHVADLINGRGKYAHETEENRRKIAEGYLQAKNGKIQRDFELKQKDLEGLKTFLQNTTSILLTLIIEKKKVDEWMYYDQSLANLGNRKVPGTELKYERHLYPWEAFEVIFSGLENPLSEYAEIEQNMLSGKGEWTSMAFRKEGNRLFVAFDPENIAYDKKKNDYVLVNGNLQHSGQIMEYEIGQRDDSWYPIASLPYELVLKMWTKDANQVSQVSSNAGIWAKNDGIWRPVGRGYYGFVLDADDSDYQWASRGVRRK